MPRRIRDYLDRLSHRDTHNEEPNTYTVNTTVNLNDWQPVRWNATQWFPDNEDAPTMVYHHNMDNPTAEVFPGRTVRASEAFRMIEENMAAREYEELASRNFNDYTPESMLRLVRLSMPNITRNTLVEERPMEVLEDSDYVRWTSLYSTNWGNMYNNHKKSHSGCKFVYKNGKLKVIKRYCKI